MMLSIRFVLITLAMAMAPLALAANDSVICKEKSSKISYKLDINWQSSKASIAQRVGTSSWQNLFAGATAVRNSAKDVAMLVEGTGKEWKGGFNGKCGRFIDVLYFDIENKSGKRVGTVHRTPKWVVEAGQKNCTAGVPAVDLETISTEISCN